MVKVCSVKSRLLRWGCVAAICVGPALAWLAPAWAVVQDNPPQTSVTLRWRARPGVSRYRLQLANDATFIDIVFDRVVSGYEYRLNDLLPGRYYWRVASLNAKRGEFSSAGVIEVPANGGTKTPSPTPPAVSNNTATTTVTSRGGWYAAIGDVARSIVAHLRGPGGSEIVAVTTDGRIVALDATRGIALWTARTAQRPPSGLNAQLIAVRARGGADDNVLVLSGSIATLIEGRTGRELWRTTLRGNAVAAVASGTKVFVVDSSLRKLFVIDPIVGRVISEAALPRRVVGNPATITYRGARAVAAALDDGALHVFDESGKLIIAANAGSPATTAPLIVRTAHGELVLVGTRSGLTALAAEDLRPLGRVTLKDDAPRGSLIAQDLDSDGRSEVVMFTERGRVVIVKSDEGRIVWEADAGRAESAAFADVNGDRVLDLLLAGREGFAFALSGRDGSVVWKDETASSVSANHAPAASPRETFAVPGPSGVLIIAADPNRTGLRAIEFPKR
jgi:outer membrane protein assembly factor BamB